LSVYSFNEIILALAASAWGTWVLYYIATMPPSPVRLFFALMALIPGLFLLVVQLPVLRDRLMGATLWRLPLSVRVRQLLHIQLAWIWSLVALAILLGDTTRPIHCVPYIVLSLIHAGKVLRLAYFEQ
jgi:hypothetical protein